MSCMVDSPVTVAPVVRSASITCVRISPALLSAISVLPLGSGSMRLRSHHSFIHSAEAFPVTVPLTILIDGLVGDV